MKRFFMFSALVTFVLAIPFSLMFWAPPQVPQTSGTYLTADDGGPAATSKTKKKKPRRKTKKKTTKRK